MMSIMIGELGILLQIGLMLCTVNLLQVWIVLEMFPLKLINIILMNVGEKKIQMYRHIVQR